MTFPAVPSGTPRMDTVETTGVPAASSARAVGGTAVQATGRIGGDDASANHPRENTSQARAEVFYPHEWGQPLSQGQGWLPAMPAAPDISAENDAARPLSSFQSPVDAAVK